MAMDATTMIALVQRRRTAFVTLTPRSHADSFVDSRLTHAIMAPWKHRSGLSVLHHLPGCSDSPECLAIIWLALQARKLRHRQLNALFIKLD